MDFLSLLKETSAYKTVSADRKADTLSHAYLILTSDNLYTGEYLKLFAALMLADEIDARAENLISRGIHPDVLSFPKNGENVLKEDVSAIIEESFLKPVEGDRKIFLIDKGQTMNAAAQNKLLKTLEEPPRGVHIIIGATNDLNLLSTLKSRMKTLVIPPFSDELLLSVLKNDCPDGNRLKRAVSCGDGTVGRAVALYGDEELLKTVDVATDNLLNMETSRDVLEFTEKIRCLKNGAKDYLPVLSVVNRDLLRYFIGKTEKGLLLDKGVLEKFKEKDFANDERALVYISEKITEAERRINANANAQAVIDKLMFDILEGKRRCRK